MSYVIKRKIISIPQGTFKPNYTVVGSPTVSNGVVSGFSANDYLETPSKITLGDGDKLEIGFLTKAPSASSTNTVSNIYNGNDKFALSIVGSNVYYLSTYVTESDGTGSSRSFSPYYIEPEEEVYCKFIIDNSTKKKTCGFSRDGINYEYEHSNFSSRIYIHLDSIMSIGKGSTRLGSSPCTTYIDLSKCYIKINDEYVWNCKYNEDVTEVKSYVAKRKSRRYYKYVSQSWTQPTLTANGTIGGNSFAVAADNETYGAAYKAFSDSGEWFTSGSMPHWLIFYNPNPLKIDRMIIKESWGESAGRGIGNFIPIIQTSVDGSSWTTIYSCTKEQGTIIPNTYNYGYQFDIDLSSVENRVSKYWRILAEQPIISTNKVASIEKITLTANAYSAIQEVTASDDYDYYEDDIKSYVIGRK